MSVTSNPSQKPGSRDNGRRRGKGVNPATRRAMEIRRAETVARSAPITAGEQRNVAAPRIARRDSVNRASRGPAALPRGIEMLYIRHDLRRMIFTAAGLLVVMLLVLVVLAVI